MTVLNVCGQVPTTIVVDLGKSNLTRFLNTGTAMEHAESRSVKIGVLVIGCTTREGNYRRIKKKVESENLNKNISHH